METLDLSGFDVRDRAQDGVDVILRDPTGRPTKVTLRIRGLDSQAYREALEQFMRGGTAAGRARSPEERDEDFQRVQATLVAGWFKDGQPAAIIFEKDGKALECTPANVAAVLRDHAWVHGQVIAFAEKRANFLPGSESS